MRDLVIIGGGAAGLVVASVTAQLGLDVVLINEDEAMGGDCLHYGCVPSKTLLKSASVAHTLRHAERWGIAAQQPGIEMLAVNRTIRRVIDSIQHHDSRERFESLGCEVVTGRARFIAARKVSVADQIFEGRRIVIATGSSPYIPPIQGLKDISYLTNEDMYSLDVLPEHLIILGGGPIGVEMAQAYRRLGASVTLIELSPRLLPRADVDLSARLHEVLQSEGITIHLDMQVQEVNEQDGIKRVILKGGEVLQADAVLVAVGRRARVESLELQNAGVEVDARGIKVNRRMQTSNRHIYACGDVTGVMPLTHVAELQAGIVIANCAFRLPKKIDDSVIPAVVYTEPEVASVGRVYALDAQPADVECHQFEVAQLDRAVTDNNTAGLAKILSREGVIIGAHIIAPHAGELIHEYALAIQNGMKVSAVTSLVHAYPSYSQLNKRVAGQYFQSRLFSPLSRKIVRWANKLIP